MALHSVPEAEKEKRVVCVAIIVGGGRKKEGVTDV
jgi:hypothetical protein